MSKYFHRIGHRYLLTTSCSFLIICYLMLFSVNKWHNQVSKVWTCICACSGFCLCTWCELQCCWWKRFVGFPRPGVSNPDCHLECCCYHSKWQFICGTGGDTHVCREGGVQQTDDSQPLWLQTQGWGHLEFAEVCCSYLVAKVIVLESHFTASLMYRISV